MLGQLVPPWCFCHQHPHSHFHIVRARGQPPLPSSLSHTTQMREWQAGAAAATASLGAAVMSPGGASPSLDEPREISEQF